jgi:hypothetical protein
LRRPHGFDTLGAGCQRLHPGVRVCGLRVHRSLESRTVSERAHHCNVCGCMNENCTGLPNLRALIEIFSQSVGPSLAIWANPVQFSLCGCMGPHRRGGVREHAGRASAARSRRLGRQWQPEVITPAQPREPKVGSFH